MSLVLCMYCLKVYSPLSQGTVPLRSCVSWERLGVSISYPTALQAPAFSALLCCLHCLCTDADGCPGVFISAFRMELLSVGLSPPLTIHPRNPSPLSLIYLLQSPHYPRWGALVGNFRSQKALRRQRTGPLAGRGMGSLRGMFYDWCSTGLKRAWFWVCASHTVLGALDNWAWQSKTNWPVHLVPAKPPSHPRKLPEDLVQLLELSCWRVSHPLRWTCTIFPAFWTPCCFYCLIGYQHICCVHSILSKIARIS